MIKTIIALALLAASPCLADVQGPPALTAPEMALPSPYALNQARTDKWFKLEYSYQALNAIDALETCTFLSEGTAHEANPLYGKHPSCGKVVAIKAASGALHYFLTSRMRRAGDADNLKWFEMFSIGVQGAVDGWNLQFVKAF